MKTENGTHLLMEHGLRVTQPRKLILEAFLETDRALSTQDLEKMLGDKSDRVTIYRTLKSFTDSGLVHRIPDDEVSSRYAVCLHSGCTPVQHKHNHMHFKCEVCGKTTCIEGILAPEIRMPKGFSLSELSLLGTGVCDECAANT